MGIMLKTLSIIGNNEEHMKFIWLEDLVEPMVN